MICDLFIATHSELFDQLSSCLHSIARFCSGFRSVLIVIPYTSRSAFREVRVPGITVNLWCWPEPSELRLGQDLAILSADTYTDARTICHVDPEHTFQRPTTPDDLLSGDLPRVLLEPLSESRRLELEPTARWLGFPVDHDTLRHPPWTYPRELYPELRAHCHRFHGTDLAVSLASERQVDFSPLDALGAFAYRFHRDSLRWTDLSAGGIAPCEVSPRKAERESGPGVAVASTEPGSRDPLQSVPRRFDGAAPQPTRHGSLSSRPSVALAVHGYHPQIGGSEMHVRWLAETLRQRGSFEPIVVAARNPEDPRVVNGVEICEDPAAVLTCDVVFTYTISDLTLQVASHLRGAGARRPVWLHHPCAVENWGLDVLLDADRIVAFNERDVELTQLMNGSVRKVARILPGVHPDRRGTPGRFRERVGADYILWVGAWEAAKGVRSLSRRFAEFRRRYPDLPLKLVMFAGYGGDEWPEPHPDIVTFDRNWEDVPDALADCLFLAFNSPPPPLGHDASPLILMEAFLNHKTFVAQSGTSFLSEIGTLGSVVDDDDGWIEAVETMIFDPARRGRLESSCGEASRSRYTLDNMVTGFETAVLELLGSRGATDR